MRNIADMTVKIWSSANCCPKSINSVIKMIKPLLMKSDDVPLQLVEVSV